MVISKNKPLQIFITLFMVVIILFTFTVKPYAEPFLLSGIGLKVFVVALSSAGILFAAQSFEGGVSGFYEGFKEYMETIKGIRDVGLILSRAGINSVYNNAKMNLNNLYVEGTNKVLNMTKALTDYIAFLRGSIETIPGAYFDYTHTYSGAVASFGRDIDALSHDLGGGYTLRLAIYVSFDIEIVKYRFSHVHTLRKDGKIVEGYSYDYGEIIFSGPFNTGNDNISAKIRYQIADDLLYVGVNGYNYTTKRAFIDEIVLPFPELAGVDTPPVVEDFPVPQAIPGEIAFPWGLTGVDIPSYVGKTLDELLQGINDMPLNPYLEGLGGLTKEQVDGFPVTGVETDVEGIITDVSVPDIPIVKAPDIALDVPIGLLGSIAGFLKNIWEWLQDMFSFPDDIGLDFAPLQVLIPKEKFPFSIPWDYANLIGLFRSEPIPPKFEIKILNEELIIDFTQFEMWAKITRNTLSVIFLVGLMFSTRKLMVGGS